ncbi:ATP-dependent zinc metalloprotease FtsH [Noviherbaspirillum sedimenti]|uniref:ATP-dependent zinc metalloprotease FtsH n=1 Tax=Noviherbaspirillum sedimenti TaxID=2320865 RepID=A0A3A3GTA1_9BURK|nr:ATP-dependent zinc metalloprotease FtsH [Noviherbaspirillum sedimenti]RJG04220.1 ATP-dependent metallopeptidase FtsH/Yme1/Tma family protein [Noviherbaspirillum sedimenti]
MDWQKQNSSKPGSPPGSRPPSGGDNWQDVLPRKTWLVFLGVLLANYLLMRFLFPVQDEPLTIPYTVFKAEVAKGNVTAIFSQGAGIEGRFTAPVTWPTPQDQQAATREHALPKPRSAQTFTTTLPQFVGPELEAFLIDNKVEISAVPIQAGSAWATLLFGFGPAILLIAFYVWLYRRATQQGGGIGGGMFGIGKSKARRYDQESNARVTFDDVAGIDEAEDELIEIVDFLRNPAKYTRLGGTAPKGVLLVGAPGTGKTLLAKAVAGEAGVPFFSMSAAEFVEMIVGVGAARVRDLFKQARENAPAIIFIDEIDTIGRARGQVVLGGSSEQEQTLNQILTEMDGFSSREGIIVLAATNQPDVLDKALLRPGRFDRRVVLNLPDKTGREAILKVHTRKVPLAADASLAELAASTPGLSGADLKNLVNEAALLAARREQNEVRLKDFMDALEKIVLGPERPLLLSDADRERIAYHESGHAILGLLVPGADPVNRVTIVPRGQSLGVTYQRPQTDRYNYPEAYLRARIIGMLGGRAAEEIVYGSKTTGAESDIEQATHLARNMVTRWGMSDALGMVQLAPQQNLYLGTEFGGARGFSEETARRIDDEVQRIIGECHAQARRLLEQHRAQLDSLVAALLARETLDEQEILAATGLPPAPPLESRPLPLRAPPA